MGRDIEMRFPVRLPVERVECLMRLTSLMIMRS
jgi:hypothetical protein